MDRSTYSINGFFEFGSVKPAKLLSKTFQKENVDMVDVVTDISQMKKNSKELRGKILNCCLPFNAS